MEITVTGARVNRAAGGCRDHCTVTYREGGILDGDGHVGPEQHLRAWRREEEEEGGEILSSNSGDRKTFHHQ